MFNNNDQIKSSFFDSFFRSPLIRIEYWLLVYERCVIQVFIGNDDSVNRMRNVNFNENENSMTNEWIK